MKVMYTLTVEVWIERETGVAIEVHGMGFVKRKNERIGHG